MWVVKAGDICTETCFRLNKASPADRPDFCVGGKTPKQKKLPSGWSNPPTCIHGCISIAIGRGPTAIHLFNGFFRSDIASAARRWARATGDWHSKSDSRHKGMIAVDDRPLVDAIPGAGGGIAGCSPRGRTHWGPIFGGWLTFGSGSYNSASQIEVRPRRPASAGEAKSLVGERYCGYSNWDQRFWTYWPHGFPCFGWP